MGCEKSPFFSTNLGNWFGFLNPTTESSEEANPRQSDRKEFVSANVSGLNRQATNDHPAPNFTFFEKMVVG